MCWSHQMRGRCKFGAKIRQSDRGFHEIHCAAVIPRITRSFAWAVFFSHARQDRKQSRKSLPVPPRFSEIDCNEQEYRQE
jgi:hypothetical protein